MNLSVPDYVSKITKLVMDLIKTPLKRASKFARDLNPVFKSRVLDQIAIGATFKNLVKMPLLYEGTKGVVEGTMEVEGKPKFKMKRKGQGGKNEQHKTTKESEIICRRCNFSDQVGHYIRECLLLSKKVRQRSMLLERL